LGPLGSVVVVSMLTLTDINRALDRLGVEPFIPRTRRALAGSLPTSSRPTAPAGRRRSGGIYRDPYGFREEAEAAIEAAPVEDEQTGLHNDGARPPVQRLMVAVLEEALLSYQRNVRSSRQWSRRRFREAEEWFASDAATWPFSFVVICETLDLEPEDIRAGLRAWRAAHASGVERGG